MIKVGLTGGIGSGKSTVAKVFEILKVPIFYADDIAKLLINNDIKVIKSIKNEFGNIYIDNKIDSKKLADIIFSKPEKLKIINSIIHPAVRKQYLQWCDKNSTKPYSIMEAAILFESGTYKILDKTITVFTPQNTRIKRVCKRNNTTPEKVIERINNQMADNEKVKLANFVIYNDDNDMVLSQVLKISKILAET